MWLMHSKGSWKEHKYVRKEGEGPNAKYYYSTSVFDTFTSATKDIGKAISEAPEKAKSPVPDIPIPTIDTLFPKLSRALNYRVSDLQYDISEGRLKKFFETERQKPVLFTVLNTKQ